MTRKRPVLLAVSDQESSAALSASDALWLLDPDDFVAARDRLAKQLCADGLVAESAGVKALRRPTRDAWAANRLARENPGAIEAVIAVGDQLRTAQAGGDSVAMRALAARRHGVVEDAVRAALELTGRLNPSVVDGLRATLGAALADAGAAAQVRAGCLQVGLIYAGLGVGPSAAPHESLAPELASRSVASRRPTVVRDTAPSDSARLVAAERALRAAEDEVTAAQLARAQIQAQVDELAAQLDEAKANLTEAQTEARAAVRARDAAAAAVERLRRR